VPLHRRGQVWYLRVYYCGREVWRSLKTKRKPSPEDAHRLEAALWAEIGAERQVTERPSSPVEQAIGDYMAALEAGRRSPHYLRRLRWVLGNIAAALGSPGLDGWTAAALEKYLQDGLTGQGWAAGKRPWRGRTANLHRDQAGFFLRWAHRRNLISAFPLGNVPKAREDHYQPRTHDRRAVVRILRACRVYDARLRNGRAPWMERAVRVALGTGARLSELQALDWSAVDFRRNRVRLIPGKGRQERVIPMARVARRALDAVPAAGRQGPVFPALNVKYGDGLMRALANARLPHCGWHSFRHTYISELVRAGVSLPVVKELAGHKNIQTTMRYVHMTSKDLDAAAARLPW